MPLYITEIEEKTPHGGNRQRYASKMPEVASQTVTISGTSDVSAAFNTNTRLIRLCADETCSVKIGGTSPEATTSDMRLPANMVEYFEVVPGDKLAVISNS